LFFKLADRTVARVSIKYLKHELIENDPDRPLAFTSPYPSGYHAGWDSHIVESQLQSKSLTFVIEGRQKMPSGNFKPVRLDHDDYREISVVFPVERSSAFEYGTFKIVAVDSFDKAYKCKGSFPINQ